MIKALIPVALLLACIGCNNPTSEPSSAGPTAESEPPRIGFSVVKPYPHDTTFFTEGLEFHEGKLFESSGSGTDGDEKPAYPSAIGIVNLQTGKVDKKVVLNNREFFGEGITFVDGKLYQLTWKNGKGFIYDDKTFKKLYEFVYQGVGWALTHDSTRIIMSTGGSNLLFIDPKTLKDTLKIQSILGVTDNNGPVSNINELEYVKGYIYANQWLTNYILKIDPSSGKVVGKMNLDYLEEEAKKNYPGSRELNGIAFNAATNSFFVTGKCWPTIYEIKLN